MFNLKKLSLVVLVSVLVCSQIGNAGFIGDPSTVIHLNKFSLIPYKWAIEQFNATAYQSFNSTGYVIQSLDDQALIQACIDDVTTVGGEILIVSGTYTASVTLKNNIRLVIEKGATGITVAIDAGATCCLEDYQNSITWYYSGGLLMLQYNNLNGLVTGIYSNFNQYWSGVYNRTDAVVNPTASYSYIVDKAGSVYRMKNGTTGQIDYSSTNVTKVVSFAIGNCSTIGGGVIFFKDGAYDFNVTGGSGTDKILLENNITLLGAGYTTVFYLPTKTASIAGFIENENCRTSTIDGYMEISNIRFEGRSASQANTNNAVIYMEGVEHVKIHNCWFMDVGSWGIDIQSFVGSPTNPSRDIEIYSNYQQGGGYNFVGMNVEAADNAYISGVDVHDNVVNYTDTGISFFGNVTDSMISSNYIFNTHNQDLFTNGIAIAIEVNGAYHPYHITIAENTIDSAGTGIAVTAGTAITISGNTVTNCSTVDGTYGAGINAADQDCLITGNIVTLPLRTNHFGILCQARCVVDGNYVTGGSGSSKGIYTSSNDVIISNNMVVDVSDGSGYGIYLVGSDNCTIIGNRVIDTDGNHQYRGIMLDTNADWNRVSDNIVSGCNVAFTLNDGSDYNIVEQNSLTGSEEVIGGAVTGGTGNLIRWNRGYKTEASGNATIATGTTSIAWAHGMVSAPAYVFIQCTNSTVTTLPTVAKNATHCIITGELGSGNYYVYAQTWNYP